MGQEIFRNFSADEWDCVPDQLVVCPKASRQLPTGQLGFQHGQVEALMSHNGSYQ